MQEVHNPFETRVPAEARDLSCYLHLEVIEYVKGVVKGLGVISQVVDGVALQRRGRRAFLQHICGVGPVSEIQYKKRVRGELKRTEDLTIGEIESYAVHYGEGELALSEVLGKPFVICILRLWIYELRKRSGQ